MQKISPLRASLEAFNRFKAQRAESSHNGTQKANTHTNPFGITFKGTVIQMDVFDSSAKKENQANPFKERFSNAGKLAASAWVSTINRFNAMKQSAIAFGSRIKENTVNTWNKLANTNVEFDLFSNSASSLQKRPVSELENMLKQGLEALKV